MFTYYEKLIESIFLKRHETKRIQIIERVHTKFLDQYPHIDRKLYNELCDRIGKEAIRVYPIVNRSLLRAGIRRAKFLFLGVVIVAIITIGSVNRFSVGKAPLFVSPLVSAFVTLIITLLTIEIVYTQRVKAAYDSVIALFLHEKNLEPLEQASYTIALEKMQKLYDSYTNKTGKSRELLSLQREEIAEQPIKLMKKSRADIESLVPYTVSLFSSEDRASQKIACTTKECEKYLDDFEIQHMRVASDDIEEVISLC